MYVESRTCNITDNTQGYPPYSTILYHTRTGDGSGHVTDIKRWTATGGSLHVCLGLYSHL